jgi:hypothetical protein
LQHDSVSPVYSVDRPIGTQPLKSPLDGIAQLLVRSDHANGDIPVEVRPWEALARDPLARLCRIQVESIRTTINFRPAAITHRDIAASALLIASRLALTAAVDAF